MCLEIWNLQHHETLRSCPVLYRDRFFIRRTVEFLGINLQVFILPCREICDQNIQNILRKINYLNREKKCDTIHQYVRLLTSHLQPHRQIYKNSHVLKNLLARTTLHSSLSQPNFISHTLTQSLTHVQVRNKWSCLEYSIPSIQFDSELVPHLNLQHHVSFSPIPGDRGNIRTVSARSTTDHLFCQLQTLHVTHNCSSYQAILKCILLYAPRIKIWHG